MAVKNGFPDQVLGDRYPFEDRYLQLDDGQTMHFIETGRSKLRRNRPTILLLHGNPTWSYLYRDFMEPLSRVARVIAIDHIGFGRSDHPEDPAYYTLEQHIRNLESFCAKMKLHNVVVVVQDWGGPIGLGYATRHPDKIAGLVVMNTWAFVEKEQVRMPWWFSVLKAPKVGEYLYGRRNLFVEDFIPRFTSRDLLDDEMDAYRHPFENQQSRTAIVQSPRMIPDSRKNPNWATMAAIEKALPDLDAPATILWADKDPAFPKRFAWAFRELLPNATDPFWIEGAGHYLQEDEPELLVQEIAEFVQTL